MAYSYEIVMIGSQPYSVYGDVDSATLYLQADIANPAVAWLAADADTKKKSLVAAVRWMDEQKWQGRPSDLETPQDLQWPRTGLLDQYGEPIADDVIPPQIPFAEFELAALLAANPNYRDEMQNTTPSQLTAGSVSISFFRPLGSTRGAKDVQVTSIFPQNVMDLVGLWLGSSEGTTSTASVQASGYQSESPLLPYPGLNRGY